jgi:ABC-type enterochelin transport system permease subunit
MHCLESYVISVTAVIRKEVLIVILLVAICKYFDQFVQYQITNNRLKTAVLNGYEVMQYEMSVLLSKSGEPSIRFK